MKRLLLFILFIAPLLFSEEIREVEIKRISSSIKIDGNLNERAWKNAALIPELFQREPYPGKTATEKTEARLMFDKDNLYLGIYCYDSEPKKIVANSMARDSNLENEDRIEILLDPFLDRRNGFLFEINPLGALSDTLISENGIYLTPEWDAIWNGRAKVTDKGWVAEIVIPFMSLPFTPSLNAWGFNISRTISRKLEEDRWNAPRLDIKFPQVSEAGRIKGLKRLSQGYGIDIKPYGLVGNAWTKEKAKSEMPSDLGGDIIYRLTPNLTSCITYNTDFAETEVDERKINLTRFPLLFQEKRTFFLESGGIFNFGEGMTMGAMGIMRTDFIPFFSRTIGLTEKGAPLPLLGGAKIVGKIGDYELGFLDVVSDKFNETPRENYLVARVKKSLWTQSYIGGILTYGNSNGNQENYLLGFDFMYRTSELFGNKNFYFLLYGLKTSTERMEGDDNAFGFSLSYPNDLFEATFSWKQIEKNFNPGLGFLYRKDVRKYRLDLAFSPRPEIWGIRQISFEFRLNTTTSLQNKTLTRYVFTAPLNIKFESGDHIEFNIFPQYDVVEKDYSVFKDVVIAQGTYRHTRYKLQFDTAPQRPFNFDFQYWFGGYYRGRNKNLQLKLNYRSGKHLILSLNVDQNDVKLPQASFISRVFELRVDYSFNPRLTLFNYFQYDNDTKNIGLNTRLRWIISPGNEVFFVINHSWIDFDQGIRKFMSCSNDIRLKIVFTLRM